MISYDKTQNINSKMSFKLKQNCDAKRIILCRIKCQIRKFRRNLISEKYSADNLEKL